MKKQPSALQRSKRNLAENLSERITFRLSRSEREALEAKANERGVKMSHLCRLIVMRRKIPYRSTGNAPMAPRHHRHEEQSQSDSTPRQHTEAMRPMGD